MFFNAEFVVCVTLIGLFIEYKFCNCHKRNNVNFQNQNQNVGDSKEVDCYKGRDLQPVIWEHWEATEPRRNHFLLSTLVVNPIVTKLAAFNNEIHQLSNLTICNFLTLPSKISMNPFLKVLIPLSWIQFPICRLKCWLHNRLHKQIC